MIDPPGAGLSLAGKGIYHTGVIQDVVLSMDPLQIVGWSSQVSSPGFIAQEVAGSNPAPAINEQCGESRMGGLSI